MKARIDLKEKENLECHRRCSKEVRKINTDDDLCQETMSVVDNLPVRCVGDWAVKKIYHLVQYFSIFSNGMKKKWNGKINYIEVCSGPGRCINRVSGLEFNGTSLSILEHESLTYLNCAYFFDFNKDVIKTLELRIQKLNIENAKVFFGDYNCPESICNILKNDIGNNYLNLVFIDPTDCSVPFDFIKKIKETLIHVDFIINIASGTDYNRNISNVVLNPKSYGNALNKYINFFDDKAFFEDEEIIKFAKSGANDELRNMLREKYKEKS